MLRFRSVRTGVLVAAGVVAWLFASGPQAALVADNIAIGKPTVVSSSYSGATQGDKAVDANTGTYWRTKYNSRLSSESIRVDLGAATSIGRVVLKWNTYYATWYRVEVSLDGASWNTVYNTTSENGGTDIVDFSPRSARYVRMSSTVWSNNRQRNWLNEFEVYADDGSPPPPPVSGSWSSVPSPNGGEIYNSLRSVAVVAPDNVWSVGTTENANRTVLKTLISRWDGSTWNLVPSPNPHFNQYGSNNQLFGVAATSATDAWAVGEQGGLPSGNASSLVLHWNGKDWASISGPDVVNGSTRLNAVAALSVTSAWAVGSFLDASTNGYRQPLIGYWNGSNWNVVPSPRIDYTAALNAVVAVSENNAWAVGNASTNAGHRPLIMHWNGTAWTEVALPGNLVSNVTTGLNSIAVVSENDIWAVGSLGARTLTMHYNGSGWQLVESPNNFTFGTGMNNQLHGVTAVSANDVWAVGSALYSRVGSAGQPINNYFTTIMHWDGSAWSMVSSPNLGSSGSQLFGVARVTQDEAWAVGGVFGGGTVIQRYTAPQTQP